MIQIPTTTLPIGAHYRILVSGLRTVQQVVQLNVTLITKTPAVNRKALSSPLLLYVMNEIREGNDESRYHSLFAPPEADVILGTKDGILFRAHSFTSLWFRAMFSLPQQYGTVQTENIHISLNEDVTTLERLLCMICGLPVPMIDSYDAPSSTIVLKILDKCIRDRYTASGTAVFRVN
jgi:hypothetical protein